jgi:hypothetical protein
MIRMRKRDFDKNHERHVKLWDELAKTGGQEEDKKFICEKLFPNLNTDSFAYCFACKVDDWEMDANYSYTHCNSCPLEWPNGRKCESSGGLFGKWRKAKSKQKRQQLAAQIRDLPWVRK